MTVGAHSSIDVEQIRERIVKDGGDETKLADLIPVPKRSALSAGILGASRTRAF